MNLSKYIGEGTLYDKKEKLENNKPKSWLKTVSAFANGIGGALIFGISDKDEVIGLDNYKKDSENISEIIKTKIEPLPKVTLKHYLIEDKNIIILFVHSGKETPYYEFEGSILLLLQNAENFIKVNTKKKWRKGNESRIEMPDYPERAIQEVLVNAIIHRDYAVIGSEIHIDIYDDRIEIYSPGGMFDGSFIQEQNIMEISSLRRNPIIADLINRVHLMERRGSGLKKIISSYQNAINYTQEKEVEFKSTQKDFKVILKNLNYKVAIKSGDKVAIKFQDEQLKKILEYIKKHNNCRTSDIENLLSVKSSRARKLLSILVSEKKIQALGQNKNRYYVLSK